MPSRFFSLSILLIAASLAAFSQQPDAANAPFLKQAEGQLTRLLSGRDLSFGMVLFAMVTAFGLGAFHALSPGHGKTIVAAYLVGSRGTLKHALFLGGMVTFTHTVSVFLLGLGALFLTRYVHPDRIIPVLSILSGLMIVWIGASLFWKRLSRLAAAHSHSHPHGMYDHHHGDGSDHDHTHGPDGHTHLPEGEVTMGSLVGLAVSGGLVPCPSALVLLLTAVAIGRIAFGLALLVAFSLGLAVVLIAIGCVVLYARNLLSDRTNVADTPLARLLPVLSAAFITVVGLVMTAVAAGWVRPGWMTGV